MPTNVFLTGEYLQRVPQWHADDAPWKAQGILRMLQLTGLAPRRIGELGCGTGEVLRLLQSQMDPGCIFLGYDISPDAIALSHSRENDRLTCRQGDLRDLARERLDILLLLDVLEHQENIFSFLRELKPLAPYKLFHSVLDLSAQALLRPKGMVRLRATSDDLHFFTKDTLLLALHEEGYKIIHTFYAPRAFWRAESIGQKLKQLPRRMLFALAPDLAARLLGGFSLFVLAS